MKCQRNIAFVLFLAGIAVPSLRGVGSDRQPDDLPIAYLYNVSGKNSVRLEWHVPRAVLEKQPKWDGLTGNPPLAVGAACSKAIQKVREQFPNIKEWTVDTVRMRNLQKGGKTGATYSFPNVWYYQITFVPKDEHLSEKLENEGLDHECTEVVLMDATVVPPMAVK